MTTINGYFYSQETESIVLKNNGLISLPESIGNLTKLIIISLSNNQLTSLPESIGNLTKLIAINLGNNQLTSLPESIGNLQNLETLNLSNNQLTSLPESIGNLINLHDELYLTGNNIKSLPYSIKNIPLFQGKEGQKSLKELKILLLDEYNQNLNISKKFDKLLELVRKGSVEEITSVFKHDPDLGKLMKHRLSVEQFKFRSKRKSKRKSKRLSKRKSRKVSKRKSRKVSKRKSRNT